jgi:hypothetical protein
MTPLILKAVRFSPEPESAMWFDVGQMPAAQEKSIQADIVMHLPFPITGIAGLDASGKDFCLWLIQGKGSVVVGGGSMWHKTYFEPFAYVQHDEGISLYRKNEKITYDELMPVHRMVVATLSKLANASTGYRATPQNTYINKKRKEKGKAAISFDWTTVEIGPKQEKSIPQGGTHASPRLHDRRGHWRKHPSGKQVWVKSCKVGDASLGVVFHDYKLAEVRA